MKNLKKQIQDIEVNIMNYDVELAEYNEILKSKITLENLMPFALVGAFVTGLVVGNNGKPSPETAKKLITLPLYLTQAYQYVKILFPTFIP